MSETFVAGGGAVTPGWYSDPYDPRQLRWWSGEGWTEHVTAAAAEPQAAEQFVAVSPAAQVAEPAQQAPLPSRRALRDSAPDVRQAASDAQQADQATQPPLTQFVAPVAPREMSAPTPTLPVATTSFLQQQGYAPLDGEAADSNGWSIPAAQPAVPPQTLAPVLSLPPVETPLFKEWNEPVQPVQGVEPAQEYQPAQAVEPVQLVQPDQPGWAAPTIASEGIGSLFSGAFPGEVAAPGEQGNQWGLSPSNSDTGSRRRSAEAGPDVAAVTDAADSASSSSFWAWLIAISPVLAAGSVAYVFLTAKPAFTDWQFEAAIAAPYLLVLLFALADRSVLLKLGHSTPRSPAWALLSAPIYLIVRAGETRRADGSGTKLTIVWFVSLIVAIAGIVGYGFLTHHALITGLPA